MTINAAIIVVGTVDLTLTDRDQGSLKRFVLEFALKKWVLTYDSQLEFRKNSENEDIWKNLKRN